MTKLVYTGSVAKIGKTLAEIHAQLSRKMGKDLAWVAVKSYTEGFLRTRSRRV